MSDSSLVSSSRPSTPGQEDLMHMLSDELKELGAITYYGEEKVLQGVLKGNAPGEPLAFMAHVDTADDVPGNGVRPVVHRNYDGKDIVLDGVVIRTDENPDLVKYAGGTVITSDGTTLLGADDKAGVAEIMAMAASLFTRAFSVILSRKKAATTTTGIDTFKGDQPMARATERAPKETWDSPSPIME